MSIQSAKPLAKAWGAHCPICLPEEVEAFFYGSVALCLKHAEESVTITRGELLRLGGTRVALSK